MKHPYEFGAILFTVALVGGILGGVAATTYGGDLDIGVHEFVDEESEKEWAKYVADGGSPAGSWTDYYKDNMDSQLECKKTSVNLQEFYMCVNKP